MAYPHPLWPSRLFDQTFGMCITPDDFIMPFYSNIYGNYYRPWKWNMPSVSNDYGSTINNDKEKFKVTLDVQHFRPDELSVKVANNQIIVEGRHEERKDEHGFISRQFTRKYTLPNDCMPEDVISNLSADGVLTVVANKKLKEFTKNEKIVTIKLCKSCPLQETVKTAMKVDQKEKIADKKTVDTSNKNKQIILKEDHCCLLLKPELLREAASETTEIIKEKTKVEQEKQTASKNTSEPFAKSCALAKSGEKCDKTAMLKSESEEKDLKSRVTMILDKKCEKTTGAMSQSEEMFATSSKSATDENFDLFDRAGASKTEEFTGKTFEKFSSATSTSEKMGETSMVKSEMSALGSMSSKTSESIECSTSSMASMTTNIKEISEELSDFVSEILCSELDKTLEIKK